MSVSHLQLSRGTFFVSMISFTKTNCHYFRGCANAESGAVSRYLEAMNAVQLCFAATRIAVHVFSTALCTLREVEPTQSDMCLWKCYFISVKVDQYSLYGLCSVTPSCVDGFHGKGKVVLVLN
jgi:hypothetical protein